MVSGGGGGEGKTIEMWSMVVVVEEGRRQKCGSGCGRGMTIEMWSVVMVEEEML